APLWIELVPLIGRAPEGSEPLNLDCMALFETLSQYIENAVPGVHRLSVISRPTPGSFTGFPRRSDVMILWNCSSTSSLAAAAETFVFRANVRASCARFMPKHKLTRLNIAA